MNLFTFTAHFDSEQSCRNHFRSERDHQGVTCKKCGNTIHYWKRDKQSYEYKKRGFHTSLLNGTIMENSKLPFPVWYRAFLMSTTKKDGGKKIALYKKLKNNSSSLSSRTSTKVFVPIIKNIPNGLKINNLDSNTVRDLALFDFITLHNGQFELTEVGKKLDYENSEKLIREQASKVKKIGKTLEVIRNSASRVTTKSLIENHPDILNPNLSKRSKIICAGYILQWAKFYRLKEITLHNNTYTQYPAGYCTS